MSEPTIIKSFPSQEVEVFRQSHGGKLPAECCHYCEQWEKEMRPYGPNGAWVCFPCSQAPERKAQTEKAFYSQLDAAGTVALIGEETGPRPLTGKPS